MGQQSVRVGWATTTMASLLKNRSLLVNLTIGAAAVALGLVVYQQKKKADARKGE